ncbi:P-type conjugative transfer protein TrbJ [Hyphomicrobium sp. CS1BSMeth3]|uniref:P-type conjugative transfer protein TrbJ n=1 Tax=Hyphomicrobium sp. CS1BSMeth3 TaxID=1892844 RepID=UPI001FCDE38B|nr:P-type conjugative transfer protein TrbJ [Hyphomicrobium sp. CS1BSMeth3]
MPATVQPPQPPSDVSSDDDLRQRLALFPLTAKPNRAARRRAARGVLTALALALLTSTAVPPGAHALTVFDPMNYQENLLSAVRALEQINNQVRTLQNQAQMIVRMDQNLMRLGSTLSPDLQRTLTDIQSQLRAGQGIALKLQETQSTYERLFPAQVSAALTSDDVVRNAKTRWEEEYAGLKRAALLQGQIVDGIETDTRLLGDAMTRSRNAVGALEATQAGNELTSLAVKQSLSLQGLLAAQHRAETVSRARDLATEDEARQRFKSFVGTGSGYSASR